MKLRVGISPCPNDVFVFSGILLGKTDPGWECDLRFEDVQTLNRLAQEGACDLIKISYANAPRCGGYRLLGCGSALGRGCGPLLLTGGGNWNPDGEVLVPGENTTANFLLDFWFRRPLRKRFLPFDALYRELRSRPGIQGVVIHEMRFTFEADGLRLVRDLGEHWEKATGHPIPLGALAYRPLPGGPEPLEIEAAVRASLDWAWSHEDEAFDLCARHAQSLDPQVIRAHVSLYVNEFTRELGKAGEAAVDFLLSEMPK